MEVELEDFYPRGIFVMKKGEEKGAKKKYALISKSGSIKVVGFETIRRDWSLIAKEVQKEVLNTILKENSPKKAFEYVKKIIENTRNKKIDIGKFIIQTQLKKNIDNYDLVGPHVVVARQMQKQGIYVGPGSIIKYIVTEGKGRIRDKAVIADKAQNYDSDYYIKNQIVPAVEKIFEVIGYTKEDLIESKDQSKLGSFMNN
jgi:DNA polymerase elongation subunit (family B)